MNTSASNNINTSSDSASEKTNATVTVGLDELSLDQKLDILNQGDGVEISKLNQRPALPTWLQNFIDTYQTLATDNLALIKNIYHPEVVFQDPLHHVVGLDALSDYFDGLYTNVLSCKFVVTDYFYQEQNAAIYWQMSFRHNKLNGGKTIEVTGHSKLKAEDAKVIYHRDYLDAGAMLYEHVPLLGSLVKVIKARASQ